VITQENEITHHGNFMLTTPENYNIRVDIFRYRTENNIAKKLDKILSHISKSLINTPSNKQLLSG
jgi:hypothetical protein